MSLAEKVAVVTGSGSGIGRAIALQLAKDSAAVAVWDLNAKAAEETVAQIKEADGRAIACVGDASCPEQIAQSLAHTLKRPCFLRFPAWFVPLLFGEMGEELLLQGQSVKSEKLLQHGFQFQFDTIDRALQLSLNE